MLVTWQHVLTHRGVYREEGVDSYRVLSDGKGEAFGYSPGTNAIYSLDTTDANESKFLPIGRDWKVSIV